MITVDTFRQWALALPEAVELPHFHKTSFRVHKRIFATLDEKAKTAVLMLSPLQQSVFCAFDKTVIYPVPGAWGKQGCTVFELGKIRKTMLKDALQVAYEEIAEKAKGKTKM